MNYFNEVKKITNLDIPDSLLTSLVFEISRFLDKQYTASVQSIQKKYNVVIDSPTRKIMRKKFYYGDFCSLESPYSISKCTYEQEDIDKAFEDCYQRLNTYDPEKIISSMKKRLEDLKNNVESDSNMDTWLKYYDTRRANKLYSFVAFRLDQDIFSSSDYNENIITDFIAKTYEGLENYRYLAIIVQGEIYNKRNECITWNLL